jgi:agmatinase
MFYQPLMMDALWDYGAAKYIVFGVPFDGTSSYRPGSRRAPDAMRQASENFESYNSFFDIDLTSIPIHDAGNLEVYSSVDETLRDLYYDTRDIVKNEKVPIMMGGEHSLTLSTVKACAKDNDDIGVIVLDAHFDLREEFGGVRNNHACVSRHILEEATDRYACIGTRSGPRDEWDFAKDNNISYYTPENVKEYSAKKLAAKVMKEIGTSQFYLSLDMDCLDPAYAPATGTPEPFGLDPWQVRDLIHVFAPHTIGFDIMEIAPDYDRGETALLGAKLLREFIAAHAAANNQ